jgi:hypothetical protein
MLFFFCWMNPFWRFLSHDSSLKNCTTVTVLVFVLYFTSFCLLYFASVSPLVCYCVSLVICSRSPDDLSIRSSHKFVLRHGIKPGYYRCQTQKHSVAENTHLIEGEEDSVHSLFVAETSNADHRCWSTTRTLVKLNWQCCFFVATSFWQSP